MSNVYDFTPLDLNGREAPLSEYQGKVMLIVNTASKCGFTPQYDGLEALYKELGEEGFVVLGFPCNQFGAQEPGEAQEIATFCKATYDVSFPMFAKVDVNGPNANPLFKWLKKEATGVFGSQSIKWNFTKFLIDRHGKVVDRYAPTTKPEELREKVQELL